MARQSVLLIYGGASTENEISCRSAAYFIKNINRDQNDLFALAISTDGKWYAQKNSELAKNQDSVLPINKEHQIFTRDIRKALDEIAKINQSSCDLMNMVVIPMIHGTTGEDGLLQGFLEMQEIAYAGCDSKASAIGMDKVFTKIICQNSEIPIVPYVSFTKYQWQKNPKPWLAGVSSKLSFPVFVKPACLGSAVGVSRVEENDKLTKAIDQVFEMDEKVLIETGIDAREVEFAGIGGHDPLITDPGEIAVDGAEFYDFDAKYVSAEAAKLYIPAKITSEQLQYSKNLARKTWDALGLYGFCRIDFFLCRKTQKFYLNEVNTIPGFTSISMFPMLCQKTGMSPLQIIEKLLNDAQLRALNRTKIKRVR